MKFYIRNICRIFQEILSEKCIFTRIIFTCFSKHSKHLFLVMMMVMIVTMIRMVMMTMMKEKRLIRVIFSRTPETLVHNDDDCDDGDNLRMVMMTMEKRRKWRKL